MLYIPENTAFQTYKLCADVPLRLVDCPHFRVELRALKEVVLTDISDWELMIRVLAGEALRVDTEGMEFVLAEGMCLAIPPGTAYTVKASEECRALFYYVQTDAQGQFASVSKAPENVQKKQALVPYRRVFSLEELGDFQDGEVVIHNVYLTPKVKCNVMFFDKGQQVGPHGRPFDGWITVLKGRIRFQIGDAQYMLQPGDSLKMPADIVHASYAEQQAIYQILVIRKEG